MLIMGTLDEGAGGDVRDARTSAAWAPCSLRLMPGKLGEEQGHGSGGGNRLCQLASHPNCSPAAPKLLLLRFHFEWLKDAGNGPRSGPSSGGSVDTAQAIST